MIRKKQFKANTARNVVSALSINSLKAGFGMFWPTSAMLISLNVLGNLLNTILLVFGIKRTLDIKKFLIINSHEKGLLKSLFFQYRDFPLLRTPQTFMNAFSVGIPILLLTSFFGPASAGFYALGKRVLKLPGQLIGKAIGNVFYPRIAEAGNKGENIQKLLLKATIGLAAMGIIPFGLIVLFGPSLFVFVFGQEWGMAGEYARWVAFWSFFIFINTPSVNAIPVLRKQGFFLFFEVFSTTIRIIALYVAFWLFNDDILAVGLFSGTGVILNAWLITYVIFNSKGWQSKLV